MPVLELRGDLSHVYAEVVPEGFLGALGRRPTLMTIASEKGARAAACAREDFDLGATLRACRALYAEVLAA